MTGLPSTAAVGALSEVLAVEAIAGGSRRSAEAPDLGVVRLYGPDAAAAAARRWPVEVAPG
jgi:hypothetical protein